MSAEPTDLPPPEPRPVPPGLTPFTSETARIAGRRGGQARRAKRLYRRREASELWTLTSEAQTTFDRDQLGPVAAAIAMDTMARVLSGEVPIRHASDAAEWVRVLVDIARLEAGQPTSASIVAHVDGAAVTARLDEIRGQAIAALASPAAQVTGEAEVPTSTGVQVSEGEVPPAASDGAR